MAVLFCSKKRTKTSPTIGDFDNLTEIVDAGGRSLMNNTGNPSAVTSFTGAIATPIPCVNVNRSLMKLRVGSDAGLSSRAERCTCR